MRTNRGNKTQHKGLLTCGLLLILLICVVVGVFVYSNYLLSETERSFGPPRDGISFSRRVQYSFAMNIARSDLLEKRSAQFGEVEFEIGQGESVNTILTKLKEKGLIRNDDALRSYLLYSGLDQSIQAGKYRIPMGLSGVEVASILQDASLKVIEVTFLPGLRMEEVARLLLVSGANFQLTEFYDACRQPLSQLTIPLGITPNFCEGFLFPGYYEFDRQSNASMIISQMVNQFIFNLPQNFAANCASHQLDAYQCVILASMIEKEAMRPEEQGLISSVFHNRILTGMKFESDPTVQYALGNVLSPDEWWKNPLSAADLTVNSPYNTYAVMGLPPSPIASPSAAALQAAAEPPESAYYYFRAKCDKSGYHNFSATFDEHLGYGCP